MRVVLSLYQIILARRTVLGDTSCEDEDEDGELSGDSEDVRVVTAVSFIRRTEYESKTARSYDRVLTNQRFKLKKSKTISGRILIFYPGYVHRTNINGSHIFYETYLNLKPPGH